jgi:AraC family transcriptional regulator
MILTEMPDLPPAPLTPQNAAFRREWAARWGRENIAILGHERFKQYAKCAYTLSLKTCSSGTTDYYVHHRTLSVDDDTYLVLNGNQSYEAVFNGEPVVEGFCLYFRPELVAELGGAAPLSWEQAADCGARTPQRMPEFAEHLRPHDALVSPVLRHIRRSIAEGERGQAWLDEQLQSLLSRLMLAEGLRSRQSQQLSAAKPSTRSELLRRVGWATDFIQSCYAQNISLDDVANAAHLSKYHMLRLFKQATGMTPHAYLQCKRATVARRLLQTTSLPVNEVVQLSGFADRSTMFRQLRKQFGASGAALRRREPGDAGCADDGQSTKLERPADAPAPRSKT